MNKLSLIVKLIGLGFLASCAHMPSLALHPDGLTPQEHVALGEAYTARGEKDLAVREYKAALKEDRHSYPAWMALGESAFKDRSWGKARAYFKKALKAHPGDPSAINNLAMIDLMEGKHLDRARKNVEKAIPTAGPVQPYLIDTLAQIQEKQAVTSY